MEESSNEKIDYKASEEYRNKTNEEDGKNELKERT